MLKHIFVVIAVCMALPCGMASAEDMDIRTLQQQAARQQAQLNDLRARAAGQGYTAAPAGDGVADGITSLRKNAVVTLGGTVNTRYYYRQGRLKSELGLAGGNYVPDGNMRTRETMKYGDFTIADAKMEAKIDVNDYFDAYLKLDFHDGASRASVSGMAQNYWIRWKNVCNTGFGVLVGRDALKFGDNQPIGVLDSWNKDNGGSFGALTGRSTYDNFDFTRGNGMFAYDNLLPAHTTYNWTRTTQINPYWESRDGTLRAEVSLIQAVDRLNGTSQPGFDTGLVPVARDEYRSINYGLGSGTARAQWKPIEGLKVTGSLMHLYAKKPFRNGFWAPSGASAVDRFSMYGVRSDSSNTAVNLAVQWRPVFLPRLNVWAQWTHGWNEAWVKDMDSDSLNYGLSYDLTENWTLFAQGDYLRTKNDQSDLWNKATGWAFYTGAVLTLPYGVNFETGWRHERMSYKGRTLGKHSKYRGNTLYAHLGFNF